MNIKAFKRISLSIALASAILGVAGGAAGGSSVFAQGRQLRERNSDIPVSYTHLTLPTILRV